MTTEVIALKLHVVDTYEQLSLAAAEFCRKRMERKSNPVICLPTGNTPLGLFRELTSVQDRSLWEQAVVVCLDEYLGVRPDEPNSLVAWLHRELLDKLPVRPENIVQIDPVHPEPYVACLEYERRIRELGGIDVTVLGLGPNGHVGFNEPGTTPDLPSRIVRLTRESKLSNASYWKGLELEIPDYGVTMGIGMMIEHSRETLLLVSGGHKAEVLRRFLQEPESLSLPASYLKRHKGLTVIADVQAAPDYAPGLFDM